MPFFDVLEWREGSIPSRAFLVLYCKHDTSVFCHVLTIKYYIMTLPITIQLFNHRTGEIYATKVENNFTTSQFEHKEKLYRWCDCLLRAVEKGEDMPSLQIICNKYPQEPSIF